MTLKKCGGWDLNPTNQQQVKAGKQWSGGKLEKVGSNQP